MIREYDLEQDGRHKCIECGTDEEITMNEDSEYICVHCLFEIESEEH